MNDDSEALQRNLLELLQNLVTFTTSDDSGVVNPVTEGSDESYSARAIASDLFIFQDAPSTNSGHLRFNTPSYNRENLLKLGEIPAVQDRFHALLKHRLQNEIQRNPPLFPWETEIHDYETEPVYGLVGSAATAASPSVTNSRTPAQVWLHQLKTLNLPIALPETLLGQLLERCQEVVQSSLLEGAKLVRSVEDLFPGQSQALNHLAGMVMTSPARSGAASPPGTNYPPNYESAVPAQQMVLSLLAAREIIAALTLTISLSQPRLERQWLTDLGALGLQADYGLDAATARLRIQATLPCSGSITLRGENLQASAQRLTAGSLSVELFDFQPYQPCTLEVCLDEQELVFAIRMTD